MTFRFGSTGLWVPPPYAPHSTIQPLTWRQVLSTETEWIFSFPRDGRWIQKCLFCQISCSGPAVSEVSLVLWGATPPQPWTCTNAGTLSYGVTVRAPKKGRIGQKGSYHFSRCATLQFTGHPMQASRWRAFHWGNSTSVSSTTSLPARFSVFSIRCSSACDTKHTTSVQGTSQTEENDS